MDFSLIVDDLAPKGFVQTTFPSIQEGNIFAVEGVPGYWRALQDCELSPNRDLYIVPAEGKGGEEKNFALAKSQMAYAPKYFVASAAYVDFVMKQAEEKTS